MDESDVLAYGFDLLDPTKIVPEELVPVTILGKMTLNRNPSNYFAETEQVMFQPGHIVRGVDFSDDPLLQGRIYSYLDTQLNRHGGPNFEQLPINRPRVPIHNNNRDGAGQMYIPLNPNAYSPNTLNDGLPMQANETVGRGFFTAPDRTVSGALQRTKASTFTDVWSQPRLFYNSLLPQEQQFIINAIRFETSHLTSSVVVSNVLIQLNRISHDIAVRVASALGVTAPDPDPTYYNDNTTEFVSIFNHTLLKLDGLQVGVLASTTSNSSFTEASQLASLLAADNVDVTVVAESLLGGADETYSAADATAFDAIVVADGTTALFTSNSSTSTLFPAGRPAQILTDAYRWGKPVAALGSGAGTVFSAAGVKMGPGVYANGTVDAVYQSLVEGLAKFKFLDRFPVDDY